MGYAENGGWQQNLCRIGPKTYVRGYYNKIEYIFLKIDHTQKRISRKKEVIRYKNCCTVFAPPVSSDLAISPVTGVTNNMLNFLFICFCIWLTISAFTFHPLAGIALAALFLSV